MAKGKTIKGERRAFDEAEGAPSILSEAEATATIRAYLGEKFKKADISEDAVTAMGQLLWFQHAAAEGAPDFREQVVQTTNWLEAWMHEAEHPSGDAGQNPRRQLLIKFYSDVLFDLGKHAYMS
jgi:hypothetical protein